MSAQDPTPSEQSKDTSQRREPIWYLLVLVCFFGFNALLNALELKHEGFSWLHVLGLALSSAMVGLWFGELPPWRRVMAWRVRKYGGVPLRRPD
jgi:hypothetical protein